MDLISPDMELRYVEDPIWGPTVRIRRPNQKPLILGGASPTQCELLQGETKTNGWRINGIRVFEGSLSVRCATPEGGRIEGSLAFGWCS